MKECWVRHWSMLKIVCTVAGRPLLHKKLHHCRTSKQIHEWETLPRQQITCRVNRVNRYLRYINQRFNSVNNHSWYAQLTICYRGAVSIYLACRAGIPGSNPELCGLLHVVYFFFQVSFCFLSFFLFFFNARFYNNKLFPHGYLFVSYL